MYFHHIHPSSNSSRLHPQLPVHPTLRSPPHCVAQLLLGVVPALDRDQPTRRQVIKASGLSSSRSYQMPMAPQLQSPLLPSMLGFVWLKIVQVFRHCRHRWQPCVWKTHRPSAGNVQTLQGWVVLSPKWDM